MTELADLLRQQAQAIEQELAAGQPTEIPAILATLDQLTALHQAVERARGIIASHAPDLVRRALLAGVDRVELFDRPYSRTRVHEYAREVGVQRKPPGPKPHGQRPAVAT